MKKWLRAQPDQPTSIAELQALIDAFVEQYNHPRPHRSLDHRGTPANDLRQPTQATPSHRQADTHHRVRRDRADTTGKITLRHQSRLYSTGIGPTHTPTHTQPA